MKMHVATNKSEDGCVGMLHTSPPSEIGALTARLKFACVRTGGSDDY